VEEDLEEGEATTTATLILRTTETTTILAEEEEVADHPESYFPEKQPEGEVAPRPLAESTLLDREAANSEGDDQNESTEADRFQVIKKQSKVSLIAATFKPFKKYRYWPIF